MRLTDAILLRDMRESCVSGTARQAREDARLTQLEVAEIVGVTPQTIHYWETGQRTPTGPRALEYGKLLVRLARKAA
ncbi:MAG: helix-turn-helix domain-containing protein [Actinomycetota bacterium]|nr:helix-turn-helix domain-containing protein [Actinomycetota bacterium]